MRPALLILATLCATPAAAEQLPICGGGKRVSCVVDGDTFWLRGEKIRLVAIDAPEAGPPQCQRPAAEARASTRMLQQLLAGGTIALERQGTDRYGRTLATVGVNGADVGEAMIGAGLARPYVPGQSPWC